MLMLRKIGFVNFSVLLLYTYIFLFTFSFLLPMICKEWYYSVYFEGQRNEIEAVKRALQLNDKRTIEAEEYFSRLRTGHLHNLPEMTDGKPGKGIEVVDIAIGIITINRIIKDVKTGDEKPGYLTQTAAAAHAEIKKNSDFGALRLFVCNVDVDPQEHQEAVLLEGVIRHVRKSESKNTSTVKMSLDGFEKGKEDYAFCMQEALKYSPRYVLLLEDDSPPVPGFFRILRHLLDNHVLHTRIGLYHDERLSPDPWLMLKLYYPEKWAGFSRDSQTVVEVIGLALVGGSLFAGVYGLLSFLCSRQRLKLSPSKVMAHFVVGAVYLVALCCLVGRPYLLRLRSLSTYTHRTVEAKDCCTQGVLYPADRAREVVQHLASTHCDIDFSVDLAIDKYAEMKHYVRHLAQPNLVKHIGMLSSIRSYSKEAAEFIWM